MSLQDHANAHADKITAIGDRVADAALGELRRTHESLLSELVSLWSTTDDQNVLNAALANAGRRLQVATEKAAKQINATLPDVVGRAFLLGAQHANDRLDTLNLDRVLIDQLLTGAPPNVGHIAAQLVRRSQKAAELLNPVLVGVTGRSGILAALGAFGRAIRDAHGGITFETTRAAGQGAAAVANLADVRRVWVAERDGCVHCLAYAGVVAGPGASFPQGLTFGSRPLKPQASLPNPPLHPHCRCTVEIIHPDDNETSDALMREARRSILRGWSLESEPQAVRLRAADRLLATGAGMPKSVEAYARNAVRRGEFLTREVPTGT